MFQRDERIVALLQQEIPMLLRGVKDPGIAGLVTITGVDLSRDRKTARVFFSVFGSPEQRQSTAKALNRAAEFVRHQLRERVQLKVVPHLEFAYDDTPERAQRVEDILGRIASEANPPDAPSPPAPKRRSDG